MEWTRQDVIKVVDPHFKSFLAAHQDIWSTTDWENAMNGTNMDEKIYAIIHLKYHDDVDKYSWFWSARPDVYKIPGVDTYYSRLSHVCYGLFIAFAFVWAPVTVYVVASCLNVAFPYLSKKQRKAKKAQAQAQAQASQPQPAPKTKPQKPTPTAKQPQATRPKELAPGEKVIRTEIVNQPLVVETKPAKRKLKGDWLYYHDRHKDQTPRQGGKR